MGGDLLILKKFLVFMDFSLVSLKLIFGVNIKGAFD